MIYLTLFWEFFKIGLLAFGGGLATVPFLYDLSSDYSWFSPQELTDMIAVSESTPGPIGVNMATYAGFKAAGMIGGLIATIGLLLPSLVIIILLARYLRQHPHNVLFENILKNVRPVALALIAYGAVFIAFVLVKDWLMAILIAVSFCVIHFVKLNPVIYILLGAIGGILWG